MRFTEQPITRSWAASIPRRRVRADADESSEQPIRSHEGDREEPAWRRCGCKSATGWVSKHHLIAADSYPPTRRVTGQARLGPHGGTT